jgi:hypothetical protein
MIAIIDKYKMVKGTRNAPPYRSKVTSTWKILIGITVVSASAEMETQRKATHQRIMCDISERVISKQKMMCKNNREGIITSEETSVLFAKNIKEDSKIK